MLTFITYYIKPPADELEYLMKTYQLTHREKYTPEKDPDEIITLMFASVKKFHPDARCCLITDNQSQFNLPSYIKIIRYPRKSYLLDVETIRALIYYLKGSKKEVNTVFLEWDQIVQADISGIFNAKADLYFAYRRIRPTPFDDAFIAIGSGHFRDVAAFFKMLLKQYSRLKSQVPKIWLGKSLIISLLLFDGMMKAARNKKLIRGIQWKNIVICLVSGTKYGRKIPIEEASKFQEGAKIIHFSNSTRTYLKQYWKKYVKDR